MNALKAQVAKKFWLILFCLWILQGGVALWRFMRHPAFTPDGRYLGVVFLLSLWMGSSSALAFWELRKHPRWLVWRERLNQPPTRAFLYCAALAIIFIRAALWYLRSLLDAQLFLQIGGYLDILAPLLNLGALTAVELGFTLGVSNAEPFAADELRRYLKNFFVLFFFLIGLALFSAKTRLGIAPSYAEDWGYGLPAVPLLEWQILLAVLLCFALLWLESKFKILNAPRIDVWIFLLVWLGAAAVWLSQPVIPSASALTPRAPNYEIYPFIDSQTYDEVAQSILIGNGFGQTSIPQRPLYILFLAALHGLVGQDYSALIFAQTLAFAFFPALLYLFGRDFFNRPVGLSLALLAILRDYVSNFVAPFTGNLSYSKVLLSEIPTAMLLLLLLLVGVRWIKSNFSFFYGALFGGILGLAMLVRTQSVIALPVLLLFGLALQKVKFAQLIKSALLLLIMAGLVVAPWLWRNWQITGGLVFDNPESQTMNLALRYSRVNGRDWQVEKLPGESASEFSARLKEIAFDAIRSNPTGAAWAFANTFLNHAVNNLLLFPLRDQITNYRELLLPASAFWERWGGAPNFTQSVLLFFYMALFGLGVAAAWMKNRWLGLLPLGLNLAYNLWTSIALLSGQRFMLAMDWSIYFYDLLGLVTCVGLLLLPVRRTCVWLAEWLNPASVATGISAPSFTSAKAVLIWILFFAIGLSLPLSERIFPQKYPPLSQGQLLSVLINSPALKASPVNSACLQKLSGENQLRILQARALYPRFYPAGAGEDFTDTPGYKVVDQSRIVFDVVGQRNGRVIFPSAQSPDFFPHASDVTLVYNANGELWFVLVRQNQTAGFYSSDQFDLSLCP
ncbi:MAG: hypothetical protein IT310_04995 [Anaerolineales bacterium]|nr:hypothetical protein [Anaerolineales bacterium]